MDEEDDICVDIVAFSGSVPPVVSNAKSQWLQAHPQRLAEEKFAEQQWQQFLEEEKLDKERELQRQQQDKVARAVRQQAEMLALSQSFQKLEVKESKIITTTIATQPSTILMSAVYGQRSTWKDVTQIVFQLFTANRPFQVTNTAMGGDPLPGIVKILRITRADGTVQDVPEHQTCHATPKILALSTARIVEVKQLSPPAPLPRTPPAPPPAVVLREAVTASTELGANIACPHCGEMMWSDATNCTIYRCGRLKGGGLINPHAPKVECDRLVAQNLLFNGCARPFRYDGKTVSKCDYI
jgi:hypothetical protein